MPIAHALLIAALAAAATSDRVPLDLLVQQMVAQVQSFPLIAIPFFMLTGTLMMGGKLGEALVGVLSTLIGRWHGGPAQVGVLSSTLFGGVSGSAVADASAIGSLLIPWHKRLGYPPAVLGRHAGRRGDHRHPDPAVDPDDPVRADLQRLDCRAVRGRRPAGPADVRRLHGGLLVGGQAAQPAARHLASADGPAFRRHLAYASPAVVLPVLIIVFLRFGIATPTEVAVLSTLYAGVVSAVIYRDLSWKRLHHAIVSRPGHRRGAAGDHGFGGHRLAADLRPDAAEAWSQWVQQNVHVKWLVILLMNVLMLFLGMFIDLPAAVLLLTPVFVPLANSIGMDMTQLGIMMVVNLAIGLYTPPVGTTLFITSALAKVKVGQTVRELGPFYLVAFGAGPRVLRAGQHPEVTRLHFSSRTQGDPDDQPRRCVARAGASRLAHSPLRPAHG
jgi:TRAP-type C4-dicarboxylate transport system permease large subunit